MTTRHDPSRRRLLGAAAGAGAGLLLAACNAPRAVRATNIGKDLVPWPEYVPAKIPKPDLPGDPPKSIQHAYLRYPTDLVTAVPERPGRGERITVLLNTNEPPPQPVGRNRLWQAINKAVGVDFDLHLMPGASYGQKLATMMASGDYPDIISMTGGTPRVADFIATECADLTPYLSGSAARDYPNLANLPPYAWKGVGRINGRLYGIPIERPPMAGVMMANRTLFDRVGGLTDWTPDEFRTRMKALTGRKKWASGPVTKSDVDRFASWNAAPNGWAIGAGGAFHPAEATDAYGEALEYTRKLVADGVYYPDQKATAELKILLYGQSIASMSDTLPAYMTGIAAVKERFKLDMGRPYRTGRPPHIWAGPGYVNYVVVKKAPPARIRLMLRILDYLASPFGSREYELCRYGVEGEHFTRDKEGQIALTPLSDKENFNSLPMQYICSPPLVAFYPGYPDAARRQYAYEVECAKYLVANPSAGIRTDASDRYGSVAGQILTDGVTNIVTGRSPVSSWDGVLRKWRDQGGDRIAAAIQAEYEAIAGR